MGVRPLLLTDIPILRKLKEPWPLGLEGRLIEPHSLHEFLRGCLLPYKATGLYSLVYQQGSIVGYVGARARWPGDKWDIWHLALRPDAELSVAESLLEELCRRAPKHGVNRIFIAMGDEAGVDLCRRLGFLAYAEETIYRMLPEETQEEEIAQQEATGFAIRPQRPRDVWGIHSLYGAVTPRPVQLAESLTSDHWEQRATGPLTWSADRREARLVLEVDASISGYLRLVAGRQAHWLEMMVHPQHRELAGQLLQAGLAYLEHHKPLPVYTALRGYQAEFGRILEDAGFQAVGSQYLLMKPLTVRVRQRQRLFRPVLEHALEPV